VQVISGALGLTGPGRRSRSTTWHSPPWPSAAAFFRSATANTAALGGWLASLPHRAGSRLFAMNDTEAGWRGWEVTELWGGLGRSYRDRRFDLLSAMRALGLLDLNLDTDPPRTARRGDGWDDVHGWPWDGAG
jgi:hypothetical protein